MVIHRNLSRVKGNILTDCLKEILALPIAIEVGKT